MVEDIKKIKARRGIL